MRCRKSFASVTAMFCLLLGWNSAAGHQEEHGTLPDAPGKKALEKICTACHDIGTVIESRRTNMEWRQNIEDMIARGADGSDEEMAAIVKYLSTYFGKTNVNTAGARELERSLGLSMKEAQAVVRYRQRHSTIKDFDELKKVPGVSAEKLQAKRGLIAFNL